MSIISTVTSNLLDQSSKIINFVISRECAVKFSLLTFGTKFRGILIFFFSIRILCFLYTVSASVHAIVRILKIIQSRLMISYRLSYLMLTSTCTSARKRSLADLGRVSSSYLRLLILR